MPLRFDKEPPWAIAVKITLTRPDGDHASSRTFPLTNSPETIDLTAEDIADFDMIAQMVGQEVRGQVMELVTHECDEHETTQPDLLN